MPIIYLQSRSIPFSTLKSIAKVLSLEMNSSVSVLNFPNKRICSSLIAESNSGIPWADILSASEAHGRRQDSLSRTRSRADDESTAHGRPSSVCLSNIYCIFIRIERHVALFRSPKNWRNGTKVFDLVSIFLKDYQESKQRNGAKQF